MLFAMLACEVLIALSTIAAVVRWLRGRGFSAAVPLLSVVWYFVGGVAGMMLGGQMREWGFEYRRARYQQAADWVARHPAPTGSGDYWWAAWSDLATTVSRNDREACGRTVDFVWIEAPPEHHVIRTFAVDPSRFESDACRAAIPGDERRLADGWYEVSN